MKTTFESVSTSSIELFPLITVCGNELGRADFLEVSLPSLELGCTLVLFFFFEKVVSGTEMAAKRRVAKVQKLNEQTHFVFLYPRAICSELIFQVLAKTGQFTSAVPIDIL